ASAYTPSVGSALDQWRTLRQSSGYRFSDYASFLIANPDWPDHDRIRGWAEKSMQPGENAGTVLEFFAADKPRTGNGWARLADAYAETGRAADALDSARKAWRSADLSSADEQAIWSRYGSSFTRADNDGRVDALLFAKKADDAARFLTATSPERQAAFSARVAMQQNSQDADSRYQAVAGSVTSDAGLMMDRARWLRASNYAIAAQQLLAREHSFTIRPADPERFMDMQLQLASDAQDARSWQTAFNIASQLDDVLPVAIAMFDRYAQGGKSLQVRTKGNYWAGRAALAAGRFQQANDYFSRAANYPELFYGQLALERLGRSVPAPPAALPQFVTTQFQRAAFNSRRLVQAIRVL